MHTRPEKDFRVTSLAWEIDIEKRHAEAGFDPIPHDVIVRRYFQFINFLQTHGMTSRIVCSKIEEINENSEWRNSDLTNDGFYFTKQFHGQWLNRSRKDKGEAKETAFLEKWLVDFKTKKQAEPFAAAQPPAGSLNDPD